MQPQGKVAICVSGQARDNGDWLRPLSDMFPGADWYFALYDEPRAHALLSRFGAKGHIFLDRGTGPTWRDRFMQKHKLFSRDNLVQKHISLDRIDRKRKCGYADNYLRMFYGIQKCADLVEGRYDFVVRTRPDIKINSFNGIPDLAPNEIAVPNYGEPHRRSDKWFVGRQTMMHRVSRIFNDLPEVMEDIPFNESWMEPEVSLLWYMEQYCRAKVVVVPDWDIDRHRVIYGDFYRD